MKGSSKKICEILRIPYFEEHLQTTLLQLTSEYQGISFCSCQKTRQLSFFVCFWGNGHFWKKYQAIRIYPIFTFALVFFIQSGNMLDQSLESYTPLLTFSDFWENKNKKTNFMLRVRSAKQHKGQLTRSVFDIDKESST